MCKLRAVPPLLAVLLFSACGGGGGNGSTGSTPASTQGIVALADTMITTATADDGEPWPVDTLATVTMPDDEEAVER